MRVPRWTALAAALALVALLAAPAPAPAANKTVPKKSAGQEPSGFDPNRYTCAQFVKDFMRDRGGEDADVAIIWATAISAPWTPTSPRPWTR